MTDGSQDFVIANYVIERFQNPILFLKNASRVLKENRILFLAIPDKETNFDRNRAVTQFSRLRDDYLNGPESSKIKHFNDFVSSAYMD